MSGELAVAVVGTGSIGVRHLQVLRALGVRVIAVPVRQGRRAELTREGYETAADLTSAKTAGARAVVVSTETSRHASDAAMAIDLGLAVLCEKPMAATAREAGVLLSAAESAGVPVFVGCCLRFDAGLQRFRERLPEAGEVHSVRVECRSYLPEWRKGRDYKETYAARGPRHGILLDIIHEVDYTCWCFGVPGAVSGRLAETRHLGLEGAEAAEGFWVTHSGGLVSVGLDYLTRHRVRHVRAAGSQGELACDFVGRTLTFRGPAGTISHDAAAGAAVDVYPRQMEAFLRVVGGGTPGPLATAAEGVASLRVCEAWAKSAATGREETV